MSGPNPFLAKIKFVYFFKILFAWKDYINGLCKLLSQLKMQIKWPNGCSASFQTGLKMYSLVLTLYKSIVRSRLEYSCPVWNPSSMQDIKKLESTQRAFTRYISGCQGLSYWDRLKNLGLISLQGVESDMSFCTCGRSGKARYPMISTSSSMITLALVLAARFRL